MFFHVPVYVFPWVYPFMCMSLLCMSPPSVCFFRVPHVSISSVYVPFLHNFLHVHVLSVYFPSPSYVPVRMYVPSVCVPPYDFSFTCMFRLCVPPYVCPLRVQVPPYICPQVYVPNGIRRYVPHRIVGGINRFM